MFQSSNTHTKPKYDIFQEIFIPENVFLHAFKMCDDVCTLVINLCKIIKIISL